MTVWDNSSGKVFPSFSRDGFSSLPLSWQPTKAGLVLGICCYCPGLEEEPSSLPCVYTQPQERKRFLTSRAGWQGTPCQPLWSARPHKPVCLPLWVSTGQQEQSVAEPPSAFSLVTLEFCHSGHPCHGADLAEQALPLVSPTSAGSPQALGCV